MSLQYFSKTTMWIAACAVVLLFFNVWDNSFIELPELEDISSVILIHHYGNIVSEEREIVNSDEIEKLYLVIKKAKKTKEHSVSDFPTVSECYEIRLVLNKKGFVKLFYYQMGDLLLMERPFDFKYEIPEEHIQDMNLFRVSY